MGCIPMTIYFANRRKNRPNGDAMSSAGRFLLNIAQQRIAAPDAGKKLAFFFRIVRIASRKCLSFSHCSSFISCVLIAAYSQITVHSPRRATASSPQSSVTHGVSEWKDARIMWASLKNARTAWYTPLRATSMTTVPRGDTM